MLWESLIPQCLNLFCTWLKDKDTHAVFVIDMVTYYFVSLQVWDVLRCPVGTKGAAALLPGRQSVSVSRKPQHLHPNISQLAAEGRGCKDGQRWKLLHTGGDKGAEETDSASQRLKGEQTSLHIQIQQLSSQFRKYWFNSVLNDSKISRLIRGGAIMIGYPQRLSICRERGHVSLLCQTLWDNC